MKQSNDVIAFFSLLRAGLWENIPVHDSWFTVHGSEQVDWEKVYQLAEEQSVTGVVLAGLELSKVKPPQELLLQWIGEVQMLKQQNKAMNQFIAEMIVKMRKEGIYTLLVKGQGLAQCYERPLWRPPGDIDLFLSYNNYEKAKRFLLDLSNGNKPERIYSKELGITIDNWFVELHGSLRTGLSSKLDWTIDEVQNDVFYGGNVRSWYNGKTQVFLPGINNDVYFVFTHFIKHFYKDGGVSLRQMCDWCRLLYSYNGQIDILLLEKRLKKAGLMTEWKAFAFLAVEFVGMPDKAMPLYSSDKKWKKKAKKIVAFILKGGEWRKIKDTLVVGNIFPLNTLRFLPGILLGVNWLKLKERLLIGS